MRLELGSYVHCADGLVGDVADVVVDPIRRRVTHLVVEPHHRHRRARLVPIELVSENGTAGAIGLRCSAEEFGRLPAVHEFAYVRVGELPLKDPDWDVGIDEVLVEPELAHPYYDRWGQAISPPGFDPRVGLEYDRIPKGEAEIRRASDVRSSDGHHLGRVDGFLVEPDEQITHLVLERGHVFGKQEVVIPIEAVTRVATDSVELSLTREQLAQLPAIPVRRRQSLSSGGEHATTEQSPAA